MNLAIKNAKIKRENTIKGIMVILISERYPPAQAPKAAPKPQKTQKFEIDLSCPFSECSVYSEMNASTFGQ